jgi:CSLREA domain-containing protein
MSRIKYSVQNHLAPTVAPLSAAIGLALGAGSLQAATITVTTLDDGSVPGQCTLRDAVIAANSDSATAGCSAGLGNDDIIFEPGLSGTINLTAGYLPITAPVTITGPGPAQLRIVGDGTDRLIRTSSTTVEISGLRLQNGYVNDPFGGAALVALGSDLRLSDCEIVDNASGPASAGGAVGTIGSIVEIDQCTISGNSVAGSIILRGSNYAYGGGLLAVESQVTITGSTFENNGSDSYGGALALLDSTATITTSSFTGNSALIGGAISLGDNALLTMSDSFITGNTAYGGGGLAIGSQSYAGLATSELYGNTAYDLGGGALVGIGYAPAVVLPEPNESVGRGGGSESMTGPGTFLLEDSYVAFNSADNKGGGIAAKYDSAVQIIDADIAYNEAIATPTPLAIDALGRGGGAPPPPRGGGLAVINGAYADVSGSYIRSNQSELGGGGFAGYGELVVNNSLIASNQASLGGGFLAGTSEPLSTPLGGGETQGGPGPSNTGQVEIYSSLIFDNQATNGGGVVSAYGGVAGVADSSISENVALDGGGGLLAFEGTLIATNNLIADNTAYQGGGVWSEGDNNAVIISQASIQGNDAAYGGGLFLLSNFDRVKYSLVEDNTAVLGGGVLIGGPLGADKRVINSTITNNTADTVGGLYTNRAILDSVTISHNASTVATMPPIALFGSRGLTENPGGAALTGDVTVISSLFSDNLSPGGTIDLSIESPGTLTIDYSLIETPGLGVSGGTGNLLNVDPQLGPVALNGGPTGTRALGPGSPAIDTGNPATDLVSDQRGQPYPRVFNGRADMGAFEFFVDGIFNDRFE